jgi:hypothetical protein
MKKDFTPKANGPLLNYFQFHNDPVNYNWQDLVTLKGTVLVHERQARLGSALGHERGVAVAYRARNRRVARLLNEVGELLDVARKTDEGPGSERGSDAGASGQQRGRARCLRPGQFP